MLQALPLLVFPILTILAALTDLTSFTIPNRLNLALAAAFFVAAPLLGAPLSMIGVNLAVGCGALVVGMGMFALGWIGGGDAKLFAAVGLWLGWPASISFLAGATVAGGALALMLLAMRCQPARVHAAILGSWAERLTTPGEPAPYGVAIAFGALAAFPACRLAQLGHVAALLGR
ncbi:MAG TPA: prepilin peptidase [Caulobacteraceae bacterium]|nr:prepilin peptidase [Caulobacteraceae bacterium]